jgi:hypothetical protein
MGLPVFFTSAPFFYIPDRSMLHPSPDLYLAPLKKPIKYFGAITP